MQDDLYAVLGVERNAGLPDIKKAYRELARRFHPDKNPGDTGAEARFKDIAEAYRVLGDAELRAQYDRHGSGSERPVPESPGEIFDEIFGTRAARFQQQQRQAGPERTRPMEPNPIRTAEHLRERARARSAPRSGGERAPERGYDLRYTIELNFEDAALGAEKVVMIPRSERCDACGGTGARPGSAPILCQDCGGSGTTQSQQGFFDVSTTCVSCGGSGKLFAQGCGTCRGSGHRDVDRPVTVKVPAGVDSGTRLKLKGEGNPGPNGGPRGDLYVVVDIRPHPFFKREDADVVTDVPVSFALAALGGDLEIPTLEGRVRMRIPAGSQTGRVFRLKGKGIPSLGREGRGDQRVRIFVETPSKLTDEQRVLFEQLATLEDTQDEGSLVSEYKSLLHRLYD